MQVSTEMFLKSFFVLSQNTEAGLLPGELRGAPVLAASPQGREYAGAGGGCGGPRVPGLTCKVGSRFWSRLTLSSFLLVSGRPSHLWTGAACAKVGQQAPQCASGVGQGPPASGPPVLVSSYSKTRGRASGEV